MKTCQIQEIDSEVLNQKGLGCFGDEFIHIPVDDSDVKKGTLPQDHQEEPDSDKDSDMSDGEEAIHGDRRKNIETIISYMVDKDDAPWIQQEHKPLDPFVRFHNEIIDYYKYYGPTEERDQLGREFFEKVYDLIKKYNKKFAIEIYGSWALGYYSILSKMDVTVLLPENPNRKKNAINQHLIDVKGEEDKYIKEQIANIYEFLIESNIFEEIELKNVETYPKLKITDKKSKLVMEIVFNQCKVIETKYQIKKFIVYFPGAKFLMLILKELLRSRDLHKLETGGLPQYYLLLLIINYFQDVFKEPGNEEMLLSDHLLNFLDLYGNKFNYKLLGISLRAGGCYFPREDKGWTDPPEESPFHVALALEDPMNPVENLGAKVTNMKQVQICFAYAYEAIRWNSGKRDSFLKCFLLKNPSK
ncbi:unnamed protein product [Moneuplotes crassus]|uniref:PAP-associated domain-containing protein n=1 Tax=Euplotes crassus TaxID=5936 RepID=A0AAD1X603_EUPCR|nr:unnamed protein product [Moneuplotes crassus]